MSRQNRRHKNYPISANFDSNLCVSKKRIKDQPTQKVEARSKGRNNLIARRKRI